VRDRFLAAWRTGALILIPALMALLASHGIRIPDTLVGWATVAAIAAGTAVWTALVHWLQTRTGTGPAARAARFLGRLLVLGVIALPTYTRTSTAVPRPRGSPHH
jgi:hypothetical protein